MLPISTGNHTRECISKLSFESLYALSNANMIFPPAELGNSEPPVAYHKERFTSQNHISQLRVLTNELNLDLTKPIAPVILSGGQNEY